MNSSLQTLEGNKVRLSITIDEGEFDRDIDQAFRKIAREVRIPGFRAGKVPRRVLEARIGVAPAREQALNDAVPQYLAKAVREHDVDLIATPEVEITSGQEDGSVAFDATMEIRPEVTVPGYGGLRVELPSPVVTDAEVDAEIAGELKRYGTLEDVERPAAAGDVVVLDLAATRDGEPVGGLNADDWSYEIGQGWVADDFDERLVGASAGDELSFTMAPKGTSEPADFTVTVSRVQQLVVPDLTDEWVAENFTEFESVEEWTANVRERLEQAKLYRARGELVGRTTAALVDLTDIDPPTALVQSELRRRVEGAARELQARGVSIEQFLQASGRDPNEFVEGFRPDAEQAVRVDLALRAVAAAEGIDADTDELEAEYQRIAVQTGQKVAKIRKAYEDNAIDSEVKAQLRKSKALDWLLHHVELVDEAGNPLDRDVVLGHSHDDGDHENVDEDRNDETSNPATDETETATQS